MRRLDRDRRGAAALEFALVSMILLLSSFALIEAGLLLWTRNALNIAAAQTARCVAVGAPVCGDPQQYAVGIAANWTQVTMVKAADVTVQINSTCNAAAGMFAQVTISSQYWVTVFPPPFASMTMAAVACFPMNPANPFS